MRKIYLIILVLVVAMITVTASAAAPKHQEHKKPVPYTCTAKAFKPFASAVWNYDLWERKDPSNAALEAKHRRLTCAPSKAHKKAMVRTWRADKRLFKRYQLYRQVAPFSGGPCDKSHPGPGDKCYWAIPAYIVCGESGYNFHLVAGAYGFKEGWAAWGGLKFASYAGAATPLEQHIVAHRGWLEHGIWTGAC